MMMSRWRDWIDARALERAVRVFERREWEDAPGYRPVVADSRAHLKYRARALRGSYRIEGKPPIIKFNGQMSAEDLDRVRKHLSAILGKRGLA